MRFALGNVAKAILLCVFSAFVILPFYWILVTSLKGRGEIIGGVTLWPEKVVFTGYTHALLEHGFGTYFTNSLLISVGGIVLNMPLAILAAYAFSRFTFKGDNHLFFWLLTNRMAPAAAFILPYYLIYTYFQLYDTTYGLILVHSIFNLPFAIWTMKGFIDPIPREIDEVASIDGYGFWSFFRRILIPLLLPGIIVTSFFVFIFSWSEFLFATVLTHHTAMPVTHAIYRTFWVSTMAPWNEVAAMTLLTAIPGIVFMILGGKYIVRGMTFGAVK